MRSFEPVSWANRTSRDAGEPVHLRRCRDAYAIGYRERDLDIHAEVSEALRPAMRSLRSSCWMPFELAALLPTATGLLSRQGRHSWLVSPTAQASFETLGELIEVNVGVDIGGTEAIVPSSPIEVDDREIGYSSWTVP